MQTTTKQQYKSSSNEAMPMLRSVSMMMLSSAAPPPPPQFPSSSSLLGRRRRCANTMMAKNQQQAPRTAVVATTTTSFTKKNTKLASLSRDDLVDVQSVVPAGLRRHALATGLPLDVALERISTFLRLQSITFVDKSSREEETGGVLECKAAAPDVHFRIYLWKWKRSTTAAEDDDDSGVVIKLERVRGCGILVQQMRRSLYRALKASSSAAPSVVPIIATEGSRRKRKWCPTSLANNNKIDDDEPDCCGAAEDRAAVTRCIALLESTSVDQQRLGMEGLVFLTDATVVSETCAVNTAERMVSLSSSSSSSGLQRLLLTHILRKGEDTTMKTLALRSLANALAVLQQLTESKPQLNESSDFGRTVIKTCISNIQNASLQPQCAALSAKCLALLSVKADDELSHFLMAAETYGKEHHSLLEREAHGLLAQLRV